MCARRLDCRCAGISGQQRLHVDAGRRHQRVAQRLAVERGGQVGAGALDDLAHQRIAVRMRAARGQAEHHVAGLRRRVPSRIFDFSTAPTAKPARSYSPAGYMPGISAVSPPISAQPASSQPWAMPLDHRGGRVHVELAAGEVVEEEQRLGALHQHVVDAHARPGRCRPCRACSSVERELELGADAVGAARPAPAPGSACGISNSAPKPPMPPSTSGRMRALRERLDALDQRVAGVDVDAGVLVREGRCVHAGGWTGPGERRPIEFALDFKVNGPPGVRRFSPCTNPPACSRHPRQASRRARRHEAAAPRHRPGRAARRLAGFCAGPNEAAWKHLQLWAGSPHALARADLPLGRAGQRQDAPAAGGARKPARAGRRASAGSTRRRPSRRPSTSAGPLVLMDDVHLYTAVQQHAAFSWFVSAQALQRGVLAAGAAAAGRPAAARGPAHAPGLGPCVPAARAERARAARGAAPGGRRARRVPRRRGDGLHAAPLLARPAAA